MTWKIREPWRREWGRYRTLLRAADLTADDVDPESGGRFLVAVDDTGTVAGGVGLEPLGRVGLLRSLVVAQGERGAGLGRAMLAAAETEARRLGVERLYLLTETAADFFCAHGYSALPREAAPAPVRQTTQFALLCPATARLMARTLGPERNDPRDATPVH